MSDNIFILHGLIQTQLSLGQPLIVIFVDFTKAFDLVNSNILFNKLMENGFFGRVLDTLRNLCSKTHFRVKRKMSVSTRVGMVAPCYSENIWWTSVITCLPTPEYVWTKKLWYTEYGPMTYLQLPVAARMRKNKWVVFCHFANQIKQ